MLSPTTICPSLASVVFPARHAAPAPQLDIVMFVGFMLTVATLFCFVEMHRCKSFCLPFAICAVATSVYGLVIGCWSLAILSLAWSSSTIQRWRAARRQLRILREPLEPLNLYGSESRITRLFGPAVIDSE